MAIIRIVKYKNIRSVILYDSLSVNLISLLGGLTLILYGMDVMGKSLERTADHCSNVAVENLQVSEGKLEAHEYLNALKAGELEESAAYTERFARY